MPDSFYPIDIRHASNVLAQLVEIGVLLRVSFGIYIKPEQSTYGPVIPSLYEIAEAVAKRDDAKLLPHGLTAENYLGFSTQVPTNVVYLTSGTPRKLDIGDRSIIFKHRAPRTFAYKGKIMPMLVLALQSIGKNNIDEDKRDVIYRVLTENPETDTWQSDISHAPAWIRKIIIDTKKRIHDNERLDLHNYN